MVVIINEGRNYCKYCISRGVGEGSEHCDRTVYGTKGGVESSLIFEQDKEKGGRVIGCRFAFLPQFRVLLILPYYHLLLHYYDSPGGECPLVLIRVGYCPPSCYSPEEESFQKLPPVEETS